MQTHKESRNLEMDKDQIQTIFRIAHGYYDLGEYDKAELELERILSLEKGVSTIEKEFVPSFILLSRIYGETGRWRDALWKCMRIAHAETDDHKMMAEHARFLLDNSAKIIELNIEDWHYRILSLLYNAISIKNDCHEYYLLLANAYCLSCPEQDLEMAAGYVAQAIKYDPDSAEHYIRLADLYLHQTMRHTHCHEALESFRIACRKKPDSNRALFMTGVCSLLMGWMDQAVSYLEKTLIQNSAHSEAYLVLGKAYQSAGRTEESIRVLKHYLTLNSYVDIQDYFPDQQPREMAVLLLCKAYNHCGQGEKAVTLLKEYLKENPGCHQARYELALNYHNNGMKESAFEQYEILNNASYPDAKDLIRIIVGIKGSQ